jgi:hypothetical protein
VLEELEEHIKYDEFMIQHVRNCKHFTISQKLKLVHQLGLDLEKTDTKLSNRHECECCGITLHISDRIGPECAKHPDKFPCNTHREGKRAKLRYSFDSPPGYHTHSSVVRFSKNQKPTSTVIFAPGQGRHLDPCSHLIPDMFCILATIKST